MQRPAAAALPGSGPRRRWIAFIPTPFRPPTPVPTNAMRSILSLTALVFLGGCASAASGPPHPPVSPSATEAGAPAAEPSPPEEGRDFVVFRGDGTRASLQEVVEKAGEAEVVLFGEQHDDLVTHAVQAELLGRLFMDHQRRQENAPNVHPGAPGVPTATTGGERSVILSLEMFERDVQLVLDEYLDDLITEDHFLASSRPWDGYEERYRPAVEFARAHGLPVVAANAPRRYVNRASRLGRESLDELPRDAMDFLPPMPWPQGSERYRAQWDSLMGPAAAHMSGTPFDGQTLWDASMGESIARTLEDHESALVLHLAGSFHVAGFTGIPETLRHYRPGTRQLVLVAEPSAELDALSEEHLGTGDFVILTRPPAN